MAELPEPLRYALATHLAGQPTDVLRASVDRLIEAYRSGSTPVAPILAGPTDVAAYAAYRMPATFSAVRASLAAATSLAATSLAATSVEPASLLDLGGGTGAAAWAAVEAFPTITAITVVDQSREALDLGARLAGESPSPALRSAAWRCAPLDQPLPAADLVTVSYVLGELPQAAADHLVGAAGAAGRTVAVIEPGTPAGYRRILAARTRLLADGFTVVAPCPHQAACPMPAGRDWCHFAARVNRSSLHRRIKDAELSYEDEKYAYVIGSRVRGNDADARVLRRPIHRKGLVQLHLCQPDGTIADRIVTKRHGADYRRARDAGWGDVFG
jgi:ribosomal protein RSM22 (predicted rRNA methylase)